MRSRVFLAVGLLVLVVVNVQIARKELLARSGRAVLLELAPVDPRSLMQGDYMALQFRASNDAFGRGARENLADGHIVLQMDASGVGKYKRMDDGSPLAADEVPPTLRGRIHALIKRF